MRIIATAVCKQGGRDYNQDAYAVHIGENNACAVVCDGLGSYVGSEIASSIAANTICERFTEVASTLGNTPLQRKHILPLFEEARDIIQEAKERDYQISSSCTTVAFFGTTLTSSIVAHIGDSRVYLIRDNEIILYTKDHSMAQFAVEMGKINRSQIRNHPDQNKLTRCLGSDYYSHPDVISDIAPLKVGDVIVLCSDGFWEYVYEEDLIALSAESLTPESALEKMEKKLLKRATKHNDNYTAIVAFVVADSKQ